MRGDVEERRLLTVLDLEVFVDGLGRMPPEIIKGLVSVRVFDDISMVVSRTPVDEAAGFMLKLPPRMRGELLRILPRESA